MPISPIVLQRRHAELGRIRLGNKGDRGQPQKLSSFRFTSASQRYIEDLAELYGGEARAWDNNGVPGWEVYTTATSIPVIAVKGGLSQWLEYWQGGGCIHRCDGENNVLTGDPCDHEEQVKTRVRGQDVWVNPHAEAKPTTRLSVMLPELEAIGVWRMESHGWNAAAEIPAVAELAQFVGDLVPANLHLVERRSVKDGKTSRFVVPVLDLQIGTARLKEIVAAKSGEGPVAVEGQAERAAITAGPAAAADEVALPTVDDIVGARDVETVRKIWKFLAAHDALTEDLKAACNAVVEKLEPSQPTQSAPDDDGPDADALWRDIVAFAGGMAEPMTTDQLLADFKAKAGVDAGSASVGELTAYLEQLKGQVAA